jgi:hypothetical protein
MIGYSTLKVLDFKGQTTDVIFKVETEWVFSDSVVEGPAV